MEDKDLNGRGGPTPATSFPGGRLFPLFSAFACLIGALGLSGLYLNVHAPRDLPRYYALQAHIFLGFAALALLFPLILMHLGRLGLPKWAAVCAGLLGITIAMPFTGLGPRETLLVPFVLWSVAGAWFLRRLRRDEYRRNVLGFICLFALAILLGTGSHLGGSARQVATAGYLTVHTWVAWAGLPLTFLHLVLDTQKSRRRPWVFSGACLVALTTAVAFGIHAAARGTLRMDQMKRSARATFPEPGSDPEGCGGRGCHSEIQKQWAVSLHRYSAVNPAYRKVFELFVSERGESAGIYCQSCHQPTLRLGPAGYGSVSADSEQAGVSCRACHLMEDVPDNPSNGRSTMLLEQAYLPGLDLHREPMQTILRDYIVDDLAPHRQSFQRDLLRSSEDCATCHRITVPGEFNGGHELTIDGVYASWKQSRQARDGIRCVDCHLQLNVFEDPESTEIRGHARPDHRFFGIQISLDEIVPAATDRIGGLRDFSSNTRRWLAGEIPVSWYEQWFLRYVSDPRSLAYRDHYRNRPLLDLSIESRPGSGSGDPIEIEVQTRNSRISHDFPGGLLTLVDVWLEVKVTDREGRILLHSGAPTPDGWHEPTPHSLGAEAHDRQGKPIRFDRFWVMTGVSRKRVIQPDATIEDRFQVSQPGPESPPLRIEARWWYRRYHREFAEWVFGPGKTLRAVPIAAASAEIRAEATAPSPTGSR